MGMAANRCCILTIDSIALSWQPAVCQGPFKSVALTHVCVQVTRHPQCRIRVTVVDVPRAQPPNEHKVHINALFVTSY